jgi:MFS family permease
MDPRPARGAFAGHPRATIAVLGYCGGLVSVSQTVSLPLLPILPDELDTSISNVSWVATASFLTGAVANPVLGRLGDMYGKRRTMILAMAILAVGCLIAAVAPNILVLVVARALQGFGTAVLPLAMSIAKDTLPPAKMTQGVALVSATLGIGSGLGLPLSGLLLGWFDWHAVFWVVLVLTLLGIGLTLRFVPDPDPETARTGRFDVIGAVWLSACLVAILLPISKSASWGWIEPLPMTLFALGIGGLFAWARYERRPEQPLVDVALMRQRPLIVINVTGVLLGFAMFSNMYISLVQLQTTDLVDYGFGASAVLAGLVLLPGALAMMFTSPISAWIIDNRGARAALVTGATVMGVSYVLRLAMLDAIWQVALGVLLVNAGVGIAYGGFPSAIMSNVPPSETASANAMGTLTRAGGAALSSAVVGALLGSMTELVAGEEVASLEAFQLAFILSAGASLLAAAVVLWLPDPLRSRTRRRVRATVVRSAPR